MHRVQFVQVLDCELVQTRFRLLGNQLTKVLFGMLALFNFGFQKLLELVNFFKRIGVTFLLSLSLLKCLAFDLLLYVHIVVFEASQCRLQYD